MRVIPWLIALLALAFGFTLWRVEETSPVILGVDRYFNEWLIDTMEIHRPEPVAVTLVEMEGAANWTALEYSLFLKALPKNDAPVVVIPELPRPEASAFGRALNTLAIQQPRLVLPVRLAKDRPSTRESFWWLRGWEADSNEGDTPDFHSVSEGPLEPLRGIVAVGVGNPPSNVADTNLTPVFFRLGTRNIPSLALRAMLLARKIPDTAIHWDNGLILGKQRLLLDDAKLSVDTSFLPGIRRIPSSDLLLSLAGADATGREIVPGETLTGVVVLGDLSDSAKTIRRLHGPALTLSEWIAATIATLCNGPVLRPISHPTSMRILIGCVLIPLLFFRQGGAGKYLVAVLLLTAYLGVSLHLAARFGLAPPIFVPICVLLFGTFLQHLAAIYPYHD